MKLQFNGKAYGMDGVYWCMQFVWWCFQQVDKSLFMDGGKTAPCGELMRWAQAHGQWVTTGYRPGDVLIYDFLGTSYKTDHCGICESVSGQYVTAIEGNTSNGNTGSQSNGDGVYRRKRKLSLVLGAYRPKYTDYRAQLQKRAGLEDKTMDYLAAYKYGADLIRKLATMKQFARFGQNSKGCVQRGHSLIRNSTKVSASTLSSETKFWVLGKRKNLETTVVSRFFLARKRGFEPPRRFLHTLLP